MAQNSELTVLFAGREQFAAAEVSTYNQQERLKKGAQAFGFCWLVALACVAVPVLHFVLTPFALLMGPVAGALVYFRVQKLPKEIRGEVQCLHRQAKTSFHFLNAKPPLYDSCQSCKTGYEVVWPPKNWTLS